MFRRQASADIGRRFHRCCELFSVVSLLVVFALPGSAQGSGVDYSGTGGVDSINGRIYFPSGRRSDLQLKVSLESSNAGTRILFVDHNGSFSFRNLEAGRYTITVDGGEEYENVIESVYIDDMRSTGAAGIRPPLRVYTLPIYLQPKRDTTPSHRPGTIDAKLADVPAPAKDLYKKALEFEKDGVNDKAVQQLKLALSIYPSFVLALNELGVLYLKLSQPDNAVSSLAVAVKLAPDEFSPRLNYGIALLNQRKFVEAETQFRAAKSVNGYAPVAHMYLGIVLAVQRKLDEAEKELLFAASSKLSETTLAHRYLGGVYMEKHDCKRAADELEIYVKLMPDAPDAERTRATIKECRRK